MRTDGATTPDAAFGRAPVCVVLAAGRSRRYGSDKTLARVDGMTMIARVLAACARFRTFAVCSPRNVRAFDDVEHVVNDEPQRGMTHSLRLADRAIAPEHAFVVVLADMPYVRPEAIEIVAAHLARDVDVAYPVCGERRGHPVALSPRARRSLADLPEGDTLRTLRDDPRLRTSQIAYADAGCYRDVDRPRDLVRRDA